jgi:hypothetical protein
MELKKKKEAGEDAKENPIQSLRQALRYLEQEARRMGLPDVAHFIGCGRMAIDEHTPTAKPSYRHLC